MHYHGENAVHQTPFVGRAPPEPTGEAHSAPQIHRIWGALSRSQERTPKQGRDIKGRERKERGRGGREEKGRKGGEKG